MKSVITRVVLKARQFQQWSVAQLLFALLTFLKLFPADASIRFADRFMRRLGPKLGRHNLIMKNLRNAYPEKDEEELSRIAVASWGHIGRLAAEYVFLDKLFDFDPENPGVGRIEVEGVERFMELLNRDKPFIVFTAHTGNFELLPVAAASFGLYVTVLFRPPNNPYVADKVFRFRKKRMGRLVPSHAGSAFALAGALEKGEGVGVLVDQKFRRGTDTQYFNQDVKTNPLLAKLARQFDCTVYPARCIRLPDNRFRLVLEPEVTLPRDGTGRIDVTATAQLLNDKVESWVREYPEQWLWYHDRWSRRKTVAERYREQNEKKNRRKK
ncbi:lipid A biosynthesis lauroyl acyltransferase [Martelella endophytica]|uniref:lipid A biosynthesis lauroyl acyltransferase n=1 Tax=Martelella endophytica TaxID=1486262 RepID=UPI0005F15137|nr:lipid A biosynthesis lauroyl acyltransferase [Martelella endophytica]